MVELLYVVIVDREEPVVASASAIIEAWENNVPDVAARVLDLQPGQEITVYKSPEVVVRRVR